MSLEQPRHFFRRLKKAICMSFFQKAGLVDSGLQPNASDYILQHTPFRRMIENIARNNGWNICPSRDFGDGVQHRRVVRAKPARQRAVRTISENGFQTR